MSTSSSSRSAQAHATFRLPCIFIACQRHMAFIVKLVDGSKKERKKTRRSTRTHQPLRWKEPLDPPYVTYWYSVLPPHSHLDFIPACPIRHTNLNLLTEGNVHSWQLRHVRVRPASALVGPQHGGGASSGAWTCARAGSSCACSAASAAPPPPRSACSSRSSMPFLSSPVSTSRIS
jgi:hypothetical protein